MLVHLVFTTAIFLVCTMVHFIFTTVKYVFLFHYQVILFNTYEDKLYLLRSFLQFYYFFFRTGPSIYFRVSLKTRKTALTTTTWKPVPPYVETFAVQSP
jgi:hypothetical protein